MTRIRPEVLDEEILPQMQGRRVLTVDDSSTACNQVRETSPSLASRSLECQDGFAGPAAQGWCDAGKKVTDEIMLMINGRRDAGDGWLSPDSRGAQRSAHVRSSHHPGIPPRAATSTRPWSRRWVRSLHLQIPALTCWWT